MQDYNTSGEYDLWGSYKAKRATADISGEAVDDFEMGVGSVAGDMITGVVKGGFDALSSISNLGVSLTNLMTGYDIEKVDFSESLGLKTHTMAGNFIGVATQFFVPFGALGKAGKAMQAVSGTGKVAKASKVVGGVLNPMNAKAIEKVRALEASGQVTKGMLWKARLLNASKQTGKGAVADFIAFDENEKRMSDLAAHIPAVGGLFEGLTYDEDDNWFEARMKNTIDGAMLGFLGDGLMTTWVSRKARKAVLKAGGTEEEALAAASLKALGFEKAALKQEAEEVAEKVTKASETTRPLPADAGDEAFAAEARAAQDQVDEARAAGKVVDEDGTVRPRERHTTVDEDGNTVELTPAESARLDAEAGTVRPREQPTAVDADGNTVELTSAESARLDEEAINWGEGNTGRVDPDTGRVEITPSLSKQEAAYEAAAEDLAEAAGAAFQAGRKYDGRTVIEGFKDFQVRTDLPTNPRALDANGKPIPLPLGLSRRAANLATRRAALRDPDGALALTRVLEMKFGQQNTGPVMDLDELRYTVMTAVDELGDLSASESAKVAGLVAEAGEEELQKAVTRMQTQSAISTEYANETSRVVKEMIQHEDTLDNEKLNHLADLFEAFDGWQSGYNTSKSYFGLGLKLPVQESKRMFRKAANAAADVCGLKPS